MGYGGAPSWVYEREMTTRDMMHHDQESRLLAEIENLKKEIEELKAKNIELETENKDLRKYSDSLET